MGTDNVIPLGLFRCTSISSDFDTIRQLPDLVRSPPADFLRYTVTLVSLDPLAEDTLTFTRRGSKPKIKVGELVEITLTPTGMVAVAYG